MAFDGKSPGLKTLDSRYFTKPGAWQETTLAADTWVPLSANRYVLAIVSASSATATGSQSADLQLRDEDDNVIIGAGGQNTERCRVYRKGQSGGVSPASIGVGGSVTVILDPGWDLRVAVLDGSLADASVQWREI